MEAVRKTHANHYGTPGHDNEREEVAGSEVAHNDCRWRLKDDVGCEENKGDN